MEQILAVTPIIRGQMPNEKNIIPPPHHSSTQQASNPAPAQQQPEAEQGDLIDFGQNETRQPAPMQVKQPNSPSDLKAAQTQNSGWQQKDLEKMLQSTSTTQGNHGPLLDFQNDMKGSLPSGASHQVLERQDTGTQSLDEFVDAEG
jgi:hypothetical protein